MIYTSTDFDGLWPVPVAAVVEADSPEEARAKLVYALEARGIPQEEPERITMLPLVTPEFRSNHSVRILSDGNF